MANTSGNSRLPARKPYQLKRTIHRVVHLGQEYVVNDLIDRMSEGMKLPDAIRFEYPDMPKESVGHLATRVKKHPYFQAYKDASLKLLTDKGAALQQNMLDLAFNSKSDMVKFSATKDAMDRVYGQADEGGGDKPTMVFNFSFGDNTPAPSKVHTVIEGETV